jgi:hypothetical protein
MIKRREFVKKAVTASLAMTGQTVFPDFLSGIGQGDKRSYVEYLRNSVLTKEEVDVFLNENSWAQFDPDVGYIMGNYMPRDGIDNSYTISTVQGNGQRTSHMYSNKPCRINTYGNSFTQCHQASDGETWQEYLAAHLGEPVRNFGMGGFGVYQAYRRMMREEQTENGAEYIILYMWGDDYVRSVFRCRYVTYYTTWPGEGGYMFHGNFWSNIEMDLDAGKLVEKENIISRKEDMYNMTDPDFMVEKLKDDLMVQLHLLSRNMVNEGIDKRGLKKLAEITGAGEVDFSDPGKMRSTAESLRDKYSFLATKYILERTNEFAGKTGRKLLLVHFDPGRVFRGMINGQVRYDKEIIDFIREKAFYFFDMNDVHVKDFGKFNLSLEEYMKHYFIGHYRPNGNHFFAYSIKNKIVDWLDPKPLTYQQDAGRLIRFDGYLPGY